MIGAELLDVLYALELRRGKNPRELKNIEGAFVTTSSGIVNIMSSYNDFLFKPDVNRNIVYFDKEKNIPVDFKGYESFFYPADSLGNIDFIFRAVNIEKFEHSTLNDDMGGLSLSESLQIIGTLLDTLKNSETKSKRWTQESLKVEMVERNPKLKQRKIDDYFSLSNKAYKSEN